MKEYRYPDFMPKVGDFVLVRDCPGAKWKGGIFLQYEVGYLFPWRVDASDTSGALGWSYCMPAKEEAKPPVLYTKEDQPMSGQPILVRYYADDDWQCRLFNRYVEGEDAPWETVDDWPRRWRYATRYDEQFWRAQQKKEEAPIVSEQARKLAERLARCCNSSNVCPVAGESCPIMAPCLEVTKDNWLAWASRGEK